MRERPLVEVRIGDELRYVTTEMENTLLLLMCKRDKLGVCPEFWGEVVF